MVSTPGMGTISAVYMDGKWPALKAISIDAEKVSKMVHSERREDLETFILEKVFVE